MTTIDYTPLVNFAEGYNDVVVTSASIKRLALAQTSGETNAMIYSIIVVITNLKRWNTGAVSGNKNNIYAWKNKLTGYQYAISGHSDSVFNALSLLQQNNYSIDISKLNNDVKDLTNTSHRFSNWLGEPTVDPIYQGLNKARSDAQDQFNSANTALKALSSNPGTNITQINADLALLRIKRTTSFTGWVMNIFVDAELLDTIVVGKDDTPSTIMITKPVPPPGDKDVDLGLLPRVKVDPVTVAMCILFIGAIAFVVNNIIQFSAGVTEYCSLGAQILSKKKDRANADPIYTAAKEATEAASILFGAFDRLTQSYPKLCNMIIAQNSERVSIMGDLLKITNSSGWNSNSNQAAYQAIMKRLQANRTNFTTTMKGYAVIRAIGKEKRVYIGEGT